MTFMLTFVHEPNRAKKPDWVTRHSVYFVVCGYHATSVQHVNPYAQIFFKECFVYMEFCCIIKTNVVLIPEFVKSSLKELDACG